MPPPPIGQQPLAVAISWDWRCRLWVFQCWPWPPSDRGRQELKTSEQRAGGQDAGFVFVLCCIFHILFVVCAHMNLVNTYLINRYLSKVRDRNSWRIACRKMTIHHLNKVSIRLPRLRTYHILWIMIITTCYWWQGYDCAAEVLSISLTVTLPRNFPENFWGESK